MAAKRRNWTKIAGIIAAVLGAVVLAVVIALALWLPGFVDARKDRAAADLSAKLARPVRIGDVDVSVLGGKARVGRVELGPARHEPQGAPLALVVEGAAVDLGLTRTLLSFGREPHVESVELHGARVNVVKLPDGTLNWQDIARRLQAEEPRPEQPDEPDERVRNAVLDEARLTGGEIAFVDLSRPRAGGEAPPTARISRIDLTLSDAGLERGADVAMHAAVLADRRNFELRARADAAPDPQGMPALREVTLRMQPTEVAPLAPFLSALSEDARGTLEQGVLSADVEVQAEGDAAVADGRIALAGARFGGGERFDAHVDLDLSLDAEQGSVVMRESVLQAGEMSLRAQGTIRELRGTPRVQDLQVSSKGLSFDRIRALYPAFDRATAPAVLRGPFAFSASGSGTRDAQRAALEVRLSDASITVPERFQKPSGTPLVLRADLTARGDTVDVSQATLRLADYRVVGRGRVRNLDARAPRFDFTVETPSPEAGSLVRLLPPVARAVGGRRIPGSLAIEAKLSGTSERYEASGSMQLRGLDVRAEGTRLEGDGSATFALAKNGDRWSAETHTDLTKLRAVYQDLFRKPEPTPFEVTAEASGRVGRPASLQVSVPEFVVSLGKSDVRGSLRLRNLNDPQVNVQARSRYLDLEDFLPQGEQPEKEQKREPSPLAKADGEITVRVDRGRASGIDYRDLDAKLRLKNGRARAETLKITAFDGQLSGEGSEFPLFAQQGPVRLRGTLKGMQTQGLLARFAGAPDLLRGTLGGSVDVTAAGLTLEEVQKSLTGQLRGSVDQAQFGPGNGFGALAQRLQQLAPVPALKQTLSEAGERLPEDGAWKLDDLTGALQFDDGAVILRNPITARTPQGELSLKGRLSLSAAGALEGTWAVEPEAIDSLVGTELGMKQPIPLTLRIEGPLTQPRFAFGDVGKVLQPLVTRFAQQQFEDQAGKGLERAIEDGDLLDRLPVGGGERGERGAKRDDEKKKKDAKDGKKKQPEQKARDEVEERLRDLF